MPELEQRDADRRRAGNIVHIGGRGVRFFASERGCWRDPMGSLRQLGDVDRALVRRLNRAARITARRFRAEIFAEA